MEGNWKVQLEDGAHAIHTEITSDLLSAKLTVAWDGEVLELPLVPLPLVPLPLTPLRAMPPSAIPPSAIPPSAMPPSAIPHPGSSLADGGS